MSDAEKLRATIRVLEVAGGLDYADRLEFSRAAGDVGAWDTAYEQASHALASITEQAVLANYPGARNVRPEKLQEDMLRVRLTAMLMKGWSLFELGRESEGLDTFRHVEKLSTYNYLHLPENALNLFWGRALLRKGEYEAALERLAPGALIANREAEHELLAAAWQKADLKERSFEQWCCRQQRRIAPKLGDHELRTYEGASVSLSRYRGTVRLLMFWFPTCSGCVDKLPILETLYKAHKTEGFVPIAIDAFADTAGVERVSKQHPVSFPLLANISSGIDVVQDVFRVKVFPVLYLVDRQERIRSAWDWQHELSHALLEQRIKALLTEQEQ